MVEDGSDIAAQQFDVVIVGAGFGGMYTLHRLHELGRSARVIEAGTDVGGTWYWNRYPGARCDVESLEYSYGFSEELQQEWEWTERYAGQPEILRYCRHVADRFDLYKDMQFETRVTEAAWDETGGRWTVRTDRGDVFSAQFLVMATGCLSTANMPDIPGRDTFGGETYHTGQWPKDPVDFEGRRVAVIGTGSSAIQSIPVIAETAGELFVFQRTASYSVPARNGPLDPKVREEIKSDYAGFRARNRLMAGGFGSRLEFSKRSALEASEEERQERYESRWEIGGFAFIGSFGDTAVDKRANDLAAEFVRSKIREVVQDPEVAALLSPKQVIGCKRLCLDTNYFETYNRPNVHLVDISEAPIDEITERGLRTGGREYDVDIIVFATGYDAMTGSLVRIDIRGRDGVLLRDAWHAGPITYLGLGTPGFPNLFVVAGPGSPSVLANMVLTAEQHGDWIADCIQYMDENGYRTIEADADAAHDWVLHVNELADKTLYPTCNSWYLGANVPGKPRVFMPLPGFATYVEKCDEVVSKGYEGFVLAD